MEGSVRSFNIFNDRYFRQRLTGCATFPQFLHLPKELRLKIWTLHLCHRRFLRVLLEKTRCNETTTAERHDDEVEDLGEWGTFFSTANPEQQGAGGAGYVRITFLDASMGSVPVLPLVCREAYETYISLYRIRLPALVRLPSNPYPYGGSSDDVDCEFETRHFVAHLHPDNDIISLQARHAPGIIKKNLLPSFLHAVLQHDFSPAGLRFGVRNLCLDLKQLGNARGDDDNDDDGRDFEPATMLSPDVLKSVRTTISHLRDLYFRLTTSHLEPRVTSGPLAGSGAQPWYNASMPILPPPSWKGFSSQVEPVEGGDARLKTPEGLADLHQVWIGHQIQPSIEVWKDLERAWGVESDKQVGGIGAGSRRDLHVRALVALAPKTSGSLETFLRTEKESWLSWMDPTTESGALHCSLFERAQQRFLAASSSSSPDAPIETACPDVWFLRRRQQTAVGYWLVDSKVLAAAKTTRVLGKKIANLSEQGGKAIDLWVFRGHG